MSYNGSGTFQINTSGQPVVAGTVISSTAFNALTADLATGLSTAITKDGQTTATVRIPFAQGISSTLTTDSSSVSTGSIITAGGVGIAKALYVGTTANIAGTTNLAGLTASSAVATDASKNLVSVTNTGTGNNVLATSPTLVTPVLGAASATSITVDAGAVGTPSITTTGDTNTGIFFPAADTIAFAEGGVESVRIDSSGNVGIGTSSPTDKLTVISAGTQVGSTDFRNVARIGLATTDASVLLGYDISTGSAILASTNNYPIAFWTSSAGTYAEKMRIDSSGNLMLNTTSVLSSAKQSVFFNGLVEYGINLKTTYSTTNGSNFFAFFAAGGSQIGGVTQATSTTVAYNTSSDYRLKENVTPLANGLTKVMALKPCHWTWKTYADYGEGFIAHELAEVCPNAVTGQKDAVDADGNPKYQGVDTSFLVATLTAAIQELKALVDTQSSTITALTARITALETK